MKLAHYFIEDESIITPAASPSQAYEAFDRVAVRRGFLPLRARSLPLREPDAQRQ
jgi:hypothetical protein